MKGLSLTQPWATLVATGAKTIETRSWSSTYRGLVAIHASKGFPRDCQALCHRDPFATALINAGLDRSEQLPLGVIVAVARILHIAPTEAFMGPNLLGGGLRHDIAVREQAFGDFSSGRYGWVLGDVRALREPIACKGALGLWAVPLPVVAQIHAQLGRAA